MFLIAMDGSDIGYNTMGYSFLYTGQTAFEDDIEYKDGVTFKIASDVQTIFLDTRILLSKNAA